MCGSVCVRMCGGVGQVKFHAARQRRTRARSSGKVHMCSNVRVFVRVGVF